MDLRDEIIEKINKKKDIVSKREQFYGLTHTYDIDENRVEFVLAPYPYDTMNALLAYIQYECAEICQEYSMDQEDIIEVLEKFYRCKKVSSSELGKCGYYAIDLYNNWEEFCSRSNKIQAIEHFKRDGLSELLMMYIDRFLES